MKHYEVVAAVFTDDQNRIYCTRRRDNGDLALKWEFPGGKIEQGETKQEALIREVKEELSTDIEVLDYIMTVDHQYNSFKITLHVYFTKIVNGDFILSEHIEAKWLDKEDLMKLDWAEADLPVVKILMEG